MKADPQAQRRLLDLQKIDTTLTQLAHRRKNLPEHAELQRLDAELSGLEDEQITAQTAVDDLDRDIARLDRDVEQVRARKTRNQARLDLGTGAPKELEALMHELGTLGRRQSELEDEELAVMERREAAQEVLDAVVQRRQALAGTREETERRCEQALADIAKDEEFRGAGRRSLAADLPGDLVAMYERVREQNGGIGAAALRFGRCEGCRIELSGGDLAMLRAADPSEVIRHEDCRRILVRTDESGL